MGTDAYECIGGPLDGRRIRLAATDKGLFCKKEQLASGLALQHWYMLLTRIDTINQRPMMFFSYRGTDRERLWAYPIVPPACIAE
jgi:hypothetical protein